MLLVSMCDGGGLRDEDGNLIGMEGDARGIAERNGQLYALCGATRYNRGLYRLTWQGKRFSQEQVLKANADWHGLWPLDDGFLAVTGGKVVKWDENFREVESYKPAGCGHINDVAVWNGSILVSAFNMGVVKLNGTQMFHSMPQPHTLVVDHENNLWSCDSTLGVVLRNGKQFAKVEGYSRGLVVREDHIVLGVSGHRHQTKSGEARLITFDMNGKITNITKIGGKEIYALFDYALPD